MTSLILFSPPTFCMLHCSSLSILAPTNRQINTYNMAVLEWLSAPQRTYLAADDIKEVNDENLHPTSLLDYVCRQTPPGIPPHLLTVKIGGIYQLLRNLSVSRNLVKNTRVIITHLGDRLITVHKIGCLNPTTNQQNVDIILPRISFSTTLPSSNYMILRKQFPLAPAYTSTFNSCQGLTLDCVGIDLTKPIFSHGQLYTAFSQIRWWSDVCIRIDHCQTTTANVVYPELSISPISTTHQQHIPLWCHHCIIRTTSLL